MGDLRAVKVDGIGGRALLEQETGTFKVAILEFITF